MPDHALPIVAILRGVTPDEVLEVADSLLQAGIRAIEVPLNSPDPIDSIRLLVERYGETCLCGAGTVLHAEQVDAVHAAGGRLIVSPNTDARVIARGVAAGMLTMPGFGSATEAFTAVQAGAQVLKLFPAGSYGPDHLRAVREVLPAGIEIWAVGGVAAENIGAWVAAGANGFGIGGGIYRAGRAPEEVGARARALMQAYRAALGA